MKKILLIALTFVLALSSCENFLEEAPKLSQSTDITLSNYAGLNNATAGAYTMFADGTWYGAFFVLDAEMRAGNATIPANNNFTSGRMMVPRDLSYNPTSTSGLWGYAYFAISAANNVIDNLAGKETLTVKKQDLDNLKAECLFIRALAHFDLVRLYAHSYAKDANGLGVPIILHTDKTASQQPKRATVAEVYAQIIADLLEAESIIDPKYARAGVTDAKAAVTLPAIQALLSRAYLYSQKWQEAADYATKVIKNTNFKLWTVAEYPTVWGKETAGAGGEVIFEVYGAKSNEYDEYWEGPAHMTSPEGYGDCAAHTDLVSLYEAGDVRGTMFRTDKNNASGGILWTKKYIGKGISTPEVNNVIVLRLSEMYLNRAEACINGATGGDTQALADINAIRANRGVAPLAGAGLEAIYAERRLELAFEGHLWFDYARTNKPSVRSDKPLAADARIWALPIPQRELDVNKNLVQNVY